MKVLHFKRFTDVTEHGWVHILDEQLGLVGYRLKPIGNNHYWIVDAEEKHTGWRLFKDELEYRSPESASQICSVKFNLSKAFFEHEEQLKTLYISSADQSHYIHFTKM